MTVQEVIQDIVNDYKSGRRSHIILPDMGFYNIFAEAFRYGDASYSLSEPGQPHDLFGTVYQKAEGDSWIRVFMS